MFTIIVTGPDRSTARHTFDDREVTFGRVAGNDVVLEGKNISRRHARLVVRDGRYIIVDLKSTNGTYVNGRKLTSPLIIQSHDKVYIGEFTVSVDRADEDITKVRPLTPFLPRDAVEAGLLRAIGESADDHSREVYADWLEQHGHAREAEFLRLQQALVGLPVEHAAFSPRTHKLRELAQTLDYRWRVRVGRPAIERCPSQTNATFDFKCPQDWGSLAPTEREDQRFCGACKKHVHYCTSVPEARDHAARGECVALDLRATRWTRDVEPPFGEAICRSCRSDLGEEFSGDNCPRCGESFYVATVGMMA